MPCDHEEGIVCELSDQGIPESLFQYIDTTQIQCLNERTPRSGLSVFKPYHKRYDNVDYVESPENDARELIFNIPFTSAVKISYISIFATGDSSPVGIHLYKNRIIDFNDTDRPLCHVQCSQSHTEVLYYGLKVTQWTGNNSISLYFPESFDRLQLRIFYIGIHGTASTLKRDPVIALYESQASMADHPIKENVHQYIS